MRTVLLKEMSTSKELVELHELYGKIQLNEWWWNKKSDKDKEDIKKEAELEKVLKNNKKDEKDDDKEEIKGPKINNNKSKQEYGGEGTKTVYNKDGSKTITKGHSDDIRSDGLGGTKASSEAGKKLLDKDEVGGSTTSGTKEQQAHHQQKVIDQFKKEQAAKKQKEASDDEKGANEWGPGGQPSASKQIDAYKKGRPSPASFKTNQRQTRELIKKQSKEVYPSVTKQDLNQFNRTKKYTADDGSQVERSTVFTKHYKTGKPLGVMTGSQRKAYDKAAAAYKAQSTPTPKPEIKPEKVPAVETKPDTYKTKIGAFLNNKKVGDVKGKTKHTITKIDHNYEEYDAKAPQVESYAAKVLVRGTGELAKRVAKKMTGTKDSAPQDAPSAPSRSDKADKAPAPNKEPAPSREAPQDAPTAPSKPSTGPSGGESQRKKPKTGKAQTATQDAPKQQESYDAYDLVLDYIMESKQASSIEEANYIMMEMDQNTIHEIVQAQKKSLDEGVKTAIGLGLLAAPWAMSQLEKRWNPIKNKRKEYQDKKATEYEKKSGTTKEDGYFR